MPTAVGQPDDERYEYIEAIDCLKLMKTLPLKLQPAILDTLSGYLCPNIDSYELQGNLGLTELKHPVK